MAEDVRIARAIELKGQLIDYTLEPRFDSAMTRMLDGLVGDAGAVDENMALTVIETLVYGPRPDGRPPVIDHYLRRHPDLPAADRSLLQDWLDRGLFGVFAVDGRRGDRLTLTNLEDELAYEVIVSMGASVARQAARGSWVATRVVPVDDLWLQSGMLRVYRPEEADLVGQALAKLARLTPTAPFRNPAKLAQARQMVHRQHEVFCEMFDGVLTVGAGVQIIEQYRAFLAACNAAADDAVHDRADGDGIPILHDKLLALRDEPDVAMAHHPVKGVVFLAGFAAMERCYVTPMAGRNEVTRLQLLDHLDDETIPAWVLDELARRHPETVDALYQAVLDEPTFSWTRDGDALLRTHKPASFVDMDVPDLILLPPLAVEALRRGA